MGLFTTKNAVAETVAERKLLDRLAEAELQKTELARTESERAQQLRESANTADLKADVAARQAVALDEALTILEEAGVDL